ncbi:MAG: hypothetical protein PHE67_07920 [Campylobacterales bacterium]|nr:hypothetical protein [Campylobacterales bacterium]
MGLTDRDYMKRNKEGSKLSDTKFDCVTGELSLEDKPHKKKFVLSKSEFLRRSGFPISYRRFPPSIRSVSGHRFDYITVGAAFLFVVISLTWIIQLLK